MADNTPAVNEEKSTPIIAEKKEASISDESKTAPSIDEKKASRAAQLAAARASKVRKRKQRDDDLADVKQKLHTIAEKLEAKSELNRDGNGGDNVADENKEEDPAVVTKRRRITRDDDEDEDEPRSSWVQGIVRTTALIGLAAGSWYFKNIYGQSPAPIKKTPASKSPTHHPKPRQKKAAPLFLEPPSRPVGASGFFMS